MNPPVINYRISHWLYYHHAKLFSRVLDWAGRLLYSCFVPGAAQISKNFKLAYWGLGVVVHTKAKMGDNCKLGQCVYWGGGITIGNNVTVGANSVVNKDIPDNAIVAGVPAIIFRMKEE